MTIELLYVPGCPNYEPALQGIREALKEERLSVEVSQTAVRDQAMAKAIGFLGSPTIRVNGMDVEPGARTAGEFGMCCRTYTGPGGRKGTPSIDLIRQALREACATTTEGGTCCG